jgi:Fic family protein
MDITLFDLSAPGELIEITGMSGAEKAFIPDPLPPRWEWPVSMWQLLMDARIALASLSGIGAYLPDPQLILRPIQFREAVRSSSLEGTFTQPRQQALFELDPEALDESERGNDAYREISNYDRALRSYFDQPQELPLSLRLIRSLHKILMTDVRGADKEPGEFRRVQVHIGMPPRFIPPPHQRVGACLDALEKYLHVEKSDYDPLVDAFLVHYQFEAIHPFRDGNGRVGRLLLSIMIAERCRMSAPWLHMSAFFDANRNEYIDRLFRVSAKADWQGWIEFCLRGVIHQAEDTEARCRKLLALRQEFQTQVLSLKGSYRLPSIVDGLFQNPVLQIPYVRKKYATTYPTAKADLEKLVKAGILVEAEDRRRRTFFSPQIMSTIYD